MHKTRFRRYITPSVTSLPNRQLTLLAALFIVGAVLGTCAAGPVTSDSALSALTGVFDGDASFFNVFIGVSKYHLIVLVFGLAAFGAFVLPAFALVKGFTLAFTSACLKVFFASGSFKISFLLFIVVEIISTIVLFMLIVASLRTSSRITRILFGGRDSFNSVFTKDHFLVVLFSFTILILLTLIYKFLFLDSMSGLLLN